MPSEILFIHDDPIAAWNLNNAVWMFGTSMSAALEEQPRSKDSKQRAAEQKEEKRRAGILQAWIPKAPGAAPKQEEPKPVRKGRFAEPKITN